MASLSECRLFNRTLTIDDISKKPHCKNLKFKRAFQFLQLLLIQRVYGIDVITCPIARRPGKHHQRDEEEHQQKTCQVFLGGSCNPTTWRHDQAIPYFQSRAVSFYNPQVADWTPELVEIEHRAKELAPLLFFVIDYDTRALASIVEVCYLAARGRNIIVVMNRMPEKNQTKFIQQKKSNNENDNEHDYENVREARRTLRTLLRRIDIPVFDNVLLALERAAFILERTKQSVTNNSMFNEDNKDDDGERDILTPLPMPSGDSHKLGTSSVVFIRSPSNKTTFESPEDFYRQMEQSEATPYPSALHHQRRSDSPESTNLQFYPTSVCAKTQLSCSTNESEDDGYGSLSSSNRTLSVSNSSISSELFESTIDHQRDDNSTGVNSSTSTTSMINNLLSTFTSYIPFVIPQTTSDSPVTQSLFILLTLPFRFMKETIFSTDLPLSPTTVSLPILQEPPLIDISSPIASPVSSDHMLDLYIASGENDECWLNTFALPSFEQAHINFTKRQSHRDNDQADNLDDMDIRKQSRVLYYLINGRERLAYLATELAFVIGERKHKIIVYLQPTIEDDAENILSPCERRDISRARKYLEDLARKENIALFHSRDQSWQEVLAFFSRDD